MGRQLEDRLERLGSLRDLLTVTAGRKIAYVTDMLDTPANRAPSWRSFRMRTSFIEAAFAGADAALARDRAHLTTTAAEKLRKPMCASSRFTSLRAMRRAGADAEVTTAFRIPRLTQEPERYFMPEERHLPAGIGNWCALSYAEMSCAAAASTRCWRTPAAPRFTNTRDRRRGTPSARRAGERAHSAAQRVVLCLGRRTGPVERMQPDARSPISKRL